MKIINAAVCVLLTLSTAFGDVPDQNLHNKCIYPTIKLQCPDESSGSGVIIRSSLNTSGTYSNIVLTAQHVAKNEISAYVPKFINWSNITGYDTFECATVDLSAKYDMAVVLFESPTQMPTAEIDFNSEFFVGSKIFKIGFGMGDDSRLDRGEITSVGFGKSGNTLGCLRVNASTIFGDSGGPCYLDSSYKIIGLTKAMRQMNGQILTDHAFICPISWLKLWSIENKNALDFVFNLDIPIPYTLKDVKQKRALNVLQGQLNDINQEILDKEALKALIETEIENLKGPEVAPAPPICSTDRVGLTWAIANLTLAICTFRTVV